MTAPADDSMATLADKKPLRTHALQGARAALVVWLLIFLFGGIANENGMKAIKFMLLPLVTMSVGGAVGGLVYHATGTWRRRGGGRRVVANVASMLAFCVAVAAAFVVGANGPN